MNREILFRGKRIDNGEWVQGYLFCIWEKAYICWGMVNDVPDMKEVDPSTVGQYTGLTDKNGREKSCGSNREYGYALAKDKTVIFEQAEISCSLQGGSGMTENEAIAFIKNANKLSETAIHDLEKIKDKAERIGRTGEYYANLENCYKEIEACEVAIKALEEIQQYRAIGTVEECQEARICGNIFDNPELLEGE